MAGGTLIRRITSESELTDAGVGVFIRPGAAPRDVRAQSIRTLGIVAAFPWGPEDEVYTPTGGQDLRDRHTPDGLLPGDVQKALGGIQFGPLKVVRVTGSGAAKAAHTFEDGAGTPTDSLVVTALYNGAAGNSISVTIAANADDATKRDVTVRLGDTTETYEAVQNSNGTLNSYTSTLVVLTVAGGATAAAAAGSATLSGGSDGTVAAGDFSSGVDLFGGEGSGVDIVACAAVPSGILDAVNSALITFSATSGGSGKHVILCTPAAESVSTAVTAGAAISRDNCTRLWPRVKRKVVTVSAETLTQDGNLVYASVLQFTDPWLSPGGRESATQLIAASVVGLETETASNANHDSLYMAGVTTFFLHRQWGPQVLGAVQTDNSTANTSLTKTWRYAKYLDTSLAIFFESFSEQPLDLDLANSRLGLYTGSAIRQVNRFLEEERKLGRLVEGINSDGTSSPAYRVDPFSMMSPAKLALGRWDIVISARDTSSAIQIVLRRSSGPGIDI